MTTYADTNELIKRGVFNSRMTLWRAIRDRGFPEGILITPSRRVWREADVDAWIASRPTGKKPGTPNAPVEAFTVSSASEKQANSTLFGEK
jgi:Prophage CP4-57 regulatory protein (AlpA)